MACVAASACVEARLCECLMLSAAGHVWSIANAAGGVAVVGGDAAEGSAASAKALWDLRSPLGVAPAARVAQQLPMQAAGREGAQPLSRALQERWVRWASWQLAVARCMCCRRLPCQRLLLLGAGTAAAHPFHPNTPCPPNCLAELPVYHCPQVPCPPHIPAVCCCTCALVSYGSGVQAAVVGQARHPEPLAPARELLEARAAPRLRGTGGLHGGGAACAAKGARGARTRLLCRLACLGSCTSMWYAWLPGLMCKTLATHLCMCAGRPSACRRGPHGCLSHAGGPERHAPRTPPCAPPGVLHGVDG